MVEALYFTKKIEECQQALDNILQNKLKSSKVYFF